MKGASGTLDNSIGDSFRVLCSRKEILALRIDMSNDPANQESASAERDFVSRLADEYKILQDKIDKIGAFRFTIKGWSITIIIVSIFAGSATKSVPGWLWATSLIAFLIGFFLFERQQTILSRRFGQRSLDIEAVLSRLLRNAASASGNVAVSSSFLTLHFVPGIGHHLRGRRSRRRQPRTRWQSFVEADAIFYFAQALVVLATLFWRSTTVPQDRANFGIVVNAFPESTAAVQNPERSNAAQTHSSQTKEVPAPSIDDKEKDRKKKKPESN